VPVQITITVNGHSRSANSGSTVADLLRVLGLESGRVAIERNREILPRSRWLETLLADGDNYEIVHFVGGG
jgi:thiamine biosynthesis protein ThiS